MPTTTYPNCPCCSSSSSSSGPYPGCCSGFTLPGTLHVSITGCISASATLTNSGSGNWVGTGSDGSSMGFQCGSSIDSPSGVWVFLWTSAPCPFLGGPLPAVTCNPIDVTFVYTVASDCGGCHAGDKVTVNITA